MRQLPRAPLPPAASRHRAALPFVRRLWQYARANMADAAQGPPVPKPVPRLPGGPDPAEPIPREPVRGIDLETYARIAAELAERREPRAAVLGRRALSESHWLEIEKSWLLRVATAALAGDAAFGQEVDRWFMAAQDASGSSAEPARSVEDYARLMVRIEAGDDLGVLLAAEKLSPADWARLQRAWTKRIAADPAARAAYGAARSSDAQTSTS